PAPRLSFQTGESRKGKPLPPFADDLARRVEPGREEVIGQAFVGKKNDPGTDYVTIRSRISSGHGLQRRPFLAREMHVEWAFSWHRKPIASVASLTEYVIQSTQIIRHRI